MKNYLETFSDTATCPIRQVLDRLSDKWSMLIILVLSHEEKMRFNELHRSIGDISQKMLTVALRSLEADGLVSRKIYPEIPPKVEYRLTEVGKSIVPHITMLSQWAQDNFAYITQSRKAFQKSK